MSEEKKRERKVKVFTNRSIWIEEDGKPVKVAAGVVVLLSSADVKKYGAAVTKDIPAELDDGE